MTTQERINIVRKMMILPGMERQDVETLGLAIAALEKQAEAEQPKRLAPFPWRRGEHPDENKSRIYDANDSCVLLVREGPGPSRCDEIIAHILAHSQGEPERIVPGVNAPHFVTGMSVVSSLPTVDPAAVRTAVEWDASACSLGRHISRSLNLPKIRGVAEKLAMTKDLRETGEYLLACLDGKKGD